jgi:hypothetical protein
MELPNQMPIDPLYAVQSIENIRSLQRGEPSAMHLTSCPSKLMKVAVPGPSPHIRPAN